MEEIKAFRCGYCTKVYESKDSCRKHESRCYFNSHTRSCASCIYKKYGDFAINPGFTSLRTCLRNLDITGKQKTQCEDYHYKKAKCDLKEMQKIRANYDPQPFIQPMIDKLRIEGEKRRIKQQEIDDAGYLLKAEAYLGHLAVAVGSTIMLRSEAELSVNNEGLVDDNEMLKHFETRQEDVDQVIYLLTSCGIEEARVKGIIKTMSEKLLQDLLYCMPLIKQGLKQIHEKMLKYCELYEDKGAVEYHKGMLERMGDWTIVGAAGNLLYPNSGIFSMDTPDLDSLDIFLRKLSEEEPTLKDEIIQGLKNPVDIFETEEFPF